MFADKQMKPNENSWNIQTNVIGLHLSLLKISAVQQ